MLYTNNIDVLRENYILYRLHNINIIIIKHYLSNEKIKMKKEIKE